MKKLTILIALGLVLAGCQNTTETTESETTDVETTEEVEMETTEVEDAEQSTDLETEETETTETTEVDGPDAASTATELADTTLGYFAQMPDENTIELDEVEWISADDTAKLEEVGLDPEEGQTRGYFLYNEEEGVLDSYELKEDTVYNILDVNNLTVEIDVNKDGFLKWLDELTYDPLIRLYLDEDGKIDTVKEVYMP